MDTLEISALEIATYIGIYEWEKKTLQKLLIDIKLLIDCTTCDENIAKTIDYDALCRKVTSFVESKHFNLIETVAEQVASLVKREFNVRNLFVKVSKPGAIKNAGNISVTIER